MWNRRTEKMRVDVFTVSAGDFEGLILKFCRGTGLRRIYYMWKLKRIYR